MALRRLMLQLKYIRTTLFYLSLRPIQTITRKRRMADGGFRCEYEPQGELQYP
jgi:hypothetical protein